MSAKKVPRGSFSACDLAAHREKMSTIIPVIHQHIGDGDGVSALLNPNIGLYDGFKEPRRIGENRICEWDYKNNTWRIRRSEYSAKFLIRCIYTEDVMRNIGCVKL